MLSPTVSLKPRFTYAYYSRGNAQFELANYSEALADFTQTVRLDSEHAKAYGNRGLVYTKLNNDRDAERDFQQAINLFLRQGDLQSYQLVRQHMSYDDVRAELNRDSASKANSAANLTEVGVL